MSEPGPPEEGERLVGEETIADVVVRYVAAPSGLLFAAGSALADEWCYLCDAHDLNELRVAARGLAGRQDTRSIFVRCAALMGVPWSEEIVPLLVKQEKEGRRLMRNAPKTMEQSPAELRKIRAEAAEESARED